MALRNGKTSANLQNTLVGSVHPPGSGISFWGTTAPAGWVLASGKTIGSLASGGTERANADTFALFDLLWTSYSNTLLPIQDSAGGASTRGASSFADFTANKRMPVIDMRGRTVVGKDNMGGSAASRMTIGGSGLDGATLGTAGGLETHTLTIAQLAQHTHIQDQHLHAIYGVAQQGVNVGQADDLNGGSTNFLRNTEYTTATNQNTGSSSAHNNTQPSIVCNYILKL